MLNSPLRIAIQNVVINVDNCKCNIISENIKLALKAAIKFKL